MQAEWLFFDLGDTIYDESRSNFERVCSLISRNGLDITAEVFLEKMREGAALYAPSPFTYAREQLGIEANYPYSSEKEVLFEGADEVLGYLSGKYRLGILANQPASTRQRLIRDGLFGRFELCLLSDAENLFKPDIAFFEYAVRKAGCDPAKAVMIGDRLDNDIYPAKKLGMRTVRIKQGLSFLQEPKSDDYRPDIEINSLRELCSLF